MLNIRIVTLAMAVLALGPPRGHAQAPGASPDDAAADSASDSAPAVGATHPGSAPPEPPHPQAGEESADAPVELALPTQDAAGSAGGVFDEEMESLVGLSLTDLLRVETSIGSIGSRPLREQSGIVTVITRQEIAHTSARDLEDILVMQVPGFAPGQDVTGVTGVGVRGFWGYSGQIVVFIDGLDMTDALFGVFPLGAHIPAEQIEKVEIIRGPGSVSYGGNAEVSVIKVTTMGAGMEGVTVNSTFGTSGNGTFAHRYGTAAGMHFGDEGHVRLSAALGRDYRSDRTFVGSDGRSLDLSDRSDIDTVLVTAGLKYQGLAVDAVFDSYHLDDQTYYGEPLDQQAPWNFDIFATSVAYHWEPVPWLTLIPKGIYNVQKPWVGTLGLPDEPLALDRTVHRITGNLTAIARIGTSSRAMLGVESWDERARAHQISGADGFPFKNGTSNYVDFQSVACYGQFELDSEIANLTVGGRYQYHTYAGNALVPRVALTRAWERFHAKAAYGKSFRTPQIEMINLAVGGPITPERATAYEFELGYQFADYLSLVSNAFYQQVNDILIYGVANQATGAPVDTYVNSDEVTTYGVENQIRARDRWGNISLTHSFYRPHKNSAKDIFGTGDDELNIALSAHKLTLNGNVNVTTELSIGASALFLSKRKGYSAESAGDYIVDFGPLFVADVFARYQYRILTVGAGVKNVLNERVDYIQASNASGAPLPDKSREYFLTLSVDIEHKSGT